jgi:outer membrane lipoprotein-sorting protein
LPSKQILTTAPQEDHVAVNADEFNNAIRSVFGDSGFDIKTYHNDRFPVVYDPSTNQVTMFLPVDMPDGPSPIMNEFMIKDGLFHLTFSEDEAAYDSSVSLFRSHYVLKLTDTSFQFVSLDYTEIARAQ